MAVLPVVFLVVAALLQLIGLARTALVVHEAARAGVRAAATAVATGPAAGAARQAAGPLPVTVTVAGGDAPGELVTVRVEATARLGPLRRRVVAEAVAMVEPRAPDMPGSSGADPAAP